MIIKKRFWNFILIGLCFVSPLFASVTLAQTKTPPPAIEKPAPTETPESTSKPSPEPTSDPEVKPDEEKEKPPTPEEIARLKKLIEADQLYLGGQYAAAEKLYREAKPPFPNASEPEIKEQTERREAITDPEKLSPAGRVYWRQAQDGFAKKLETKIFVPLELLVQQHPDFIPGQALYAQALKEYNRKEEAAKLREKLINLYPDHPDVVKLKIAELGEQENWLEASLEARQFALLNPTSPAVDEFTALADQNLKRYQSHLRAKIRGNAIANVITGALGYALTGNLFGPISAVETTALLLRGESAVGKSIANRAQRQLPMIEDAETLKYVRGIGNKLAIVAGRNDFEYEFYVINDEKLNAFALPGGKVFVNAGAITKTNSEAELAGLLAHELSHAVLSHGFQLITRGSVTANVTRFIPYGGLLGNLIVLDYSRDMERQSDIVGTRILASTGYAADGMYNLMGILNKEDKNSPIFTWLSSHPVTDQRIKYLQNLIVKNGYNRYKYEGVAQHNQIKGRVKKLLVKPKKDKDKPEVQRDKE